jgi:hypothetical protein
MNKLGKELVNLKPINDIFATIENSTGNFSDKVFDRRMPDFTLETFFIDLWLYTTLTTIAVIFFYKYRLWRNDK